MADEALPFQLTITVTDSAQTRRLQQVVAQSAFELDGFEVERYGAGDEATGVITQICTSIGWITLGAGALKQLRRALNEIAAAMTDVPDEDVSIEVNGEVVPIASVTDDMLTNLLAS